MAITDQVKSSTEKESCPISMGLYLDSLGLQTAAYFKANGDDSVRLLSDSMPRIPPCALIPMWDGEPLRADFIWPPHPRGVGLDWPIEARIEQNEDPLRYPAAYALNEFRNQSSRHWASCNSRRKPYRTISPSQALASMIGAVIAPNVAAGMIERPVVVISNNLNTSQQQELIDELANIGVQPRLLWRPVAALLGLLSLYHDGKLSKEDVRVNNTIGVLHLGLDEWEFTPVQYVKYFNNINPVPARQRPDRGTTIGSWGFQLMYRVANELARILNVPESWRYTWRLLWSTPWQELLLRRLYGSPDFDAENACGLGSNLFNESQRIWRSEYSNLQNLPELTGLGQRLPRWGRRDSTATWIQIVRKICLARQIRSLVVTGSLARVKVDQGVRLGELIAGRLIDLPCKVLIGGESIPDNLVGLGAGYCSMSYANEKIAYLDTLPRMSTVVARSGELTWEPLLDDNEKYVPAGIVYRRPDNLEGFAISPNTSELTIAIDHEEFSTVREVKALIGTSSTQVQESVALGVAVEPAAGNARVEVIPQKKGLFANRKVFIEWKTMSDTGKSPSEWVEAQPRTHPSIAPRIASKVRWTAVAPGLNDLLDVLEGKKIGLSRILDKVKEQLRAPDRSPFGEHSTAVSSDGIPGINSSANQFLVKRTSELLVEKLDAKSLRSRSDQHKEILKVVGSISSPDPSTQEYAQKLVVLIASDISSANESHLRFIGGCLRDPEGILLFSKCLHKRLSSSLTGVNDWLKAYSELLQYREDALSMVDSDLCLSLSKHVLWIFEQQVSQYNAAFVFRYAALVIVFLLRRRAWDDQYLDPNSALAEKTKSAFKEAIRLINMKKMRAMGGVVNIPSTLQQMISYIDRCGTGKILLAID